MNELERILRSWSLLLAPIEAARHLALLPSFLRHRVTTLMANFTISTCMHVDVEHVIPVQTKPCRCLTHVVGTDMGLEAG